MHLFLCTPGGVQSNTDRKIGLTPAEVDSVSKEFSYQLKPSLSIMKSLALRERIIKWEMDFMTLCH